MILVAMLKEVLASAALYLSQLSGIAEEVVIAGTIHVALHLLDSTVAAIDLNAEYVETLIYLMGENCPEVPLARSSGRQIE
jgi:hypothetical protein